MAELLGGRYRLGALLGSGGMARVFTAHDELLDRTVAVKVFTPGVADPAAGERQRGEVRLLARLSHPNLVTVFDADLTQDDAAGGTPSYLVMELVPGPSLAQEIGPPLAPRRVAGIGADIAAALAYIHGNGVTHRDVKPANVLLTSAGEDATAKLVDFGIAQLIDAPRLTRPGEAIGTAAYLSPEQVSGGAVDGASDIYSLGLVLIECLTGERRFTGAGIEVALARLHASPVVPAGVPPAWQGLLADMTAMEPGARPAAAAVSEALLELARAPEPTEPFVTPTSLLTPPTSLLAEPTSLLTPPTSLLAEPHRLEPVEAARGHRRRTALLAAGLALVLAAVGTGFALSGGGSGAKRGPAVSPPKAVPVVAATSSSPSAAPSPTTVSVAVSTSAVSPSAAAVPAGPGPAGPGVTGPGVTGPGVAPGPVTPPGHRKGKGHGKHG